jgi:glycosyltransferase involved in cell wall biosynthesis
LSAPDDVRRPLLLVTNMVPPARVGAFAALAARERVCFALYGGRAHHAAAPVDQDELPFDVVSTSQAGVGRLAASGRFGGVVCGTGGRIALPATYAGARRAGVPFALWATLWAQPRSAAGIAGYPALRWVYAHADAVATYGPHVSAYVRARGARQVFEAPQAVDNEFWSGGGARADRRAPFQVVFAGRLEREKGIEVLLEAWRRLGAQPDTARLVLAGDGPARAAAAAVPGTECVGQLTAPALRDLYAGADLLVVPSIPTATFREPWGLVVNEACCRGLAVVASDAVGAAAGGLVEDGVSGLVVPAGNAAALAAALRRLRDDAALRARLAEAARLAVAHYTHAAWAEGILRAVRAAEERRGRGGVVRK